MAGAKNPNPYIITGRKVGQTSHQVKTHLLCAECEDRFNKNGERWILANGYRGQGHFALRDAVKSTKPEIVTETHEVFRATDNPGLDTEKLVYFATSVFWRASVSDWGDVTVSGKLGGRYEEEFRRFLLGEAQFPTNAALVIEVSDSQSPALYATLPTGGNQGGYHQHGFVVLGVMFHLVVGARLPSAIQRVCFVRSPERPLLLTDKLDSKIMTVARRVSESALAKRKAR